MNVSRSSGLGTKKTIFALGIAMLPAWSWAQSSVTLYGTLDVGMLFTSKTLNAATGANRGKQFSLINGGLEPSNFGLFGQEDLGGGLKATFRLESGVSVVNGGFDNSNGNLFGRQAWLALSGNFGELKAGVQYSPFVLAIYESDPRNAGQFGTAFSVYADNTFVGTFNPNAITYTSPKFAGFSGSAMYAFGGVPGDYRAGQQYSLSARYEFRGLVVNAAMYDSSSGRGSAALTTFQQPFFGRMIGVGYHFDRLTVKGSFTSYKVPTTVAGGVVNGGTNNVWNVGFDYYALPQLDINAGLWYIRDPHDSDNHTLLGALTTRYFLSKATSLYMQVGAVNNHGRERFGLSIDNALYGVSGTTVGAIIGINKRF
ncbi:porin [Burkholderia multivorans]|uniref:porin n=2 Tax=Burkholderia multivorans TaxID=87883 RepID=UPI001C2467C4|nr:porin [Burkholderia multivorans]MBU9222259.1 porin [Burkholderia multivorans]MBU9417681.1 porin [Burkholderia multivorans]MBU9476818.1 porin [Burkholderia multivorans]